MSKHNTYQREYLRKRRASARADGLCEGCCKRKPEGGFAKCYACRTGRQAGAAGEFCTQCLAFHPRGAHRSERRLLW